VATIFEKLGLSGEYSQEAVDTIDGELRKLEPKIIAARGKRLEARDAQKKIGNQWDELTVARGALMDKRDARPGDVTVG